MEEREQLLDIFEDAPCGFLALSPTGKIVRINHTLTEWLRVTADDVLESPLHNLLSPGGRIAFETHINPLLRLQGFANELSLDLLDSEGKRVPFVTNISVRRGDAGEHISTRFALFKAEDRRAYEKSIIAAREAAEAAAQSERDTALLREQFIAVLGHDLRNPLTAIISGINILSRGANLSDSDNDILESMKKSAWRAEHLIRDVLDFARGRLGEGLILQRSSDNDLSEVLTQVIDEIRATELSPDIRADFAIEHPVFCDSDRIGQLLSNLLSNAVTHGDPSCGITVSATTTEHDFTLSVENSGEPIPEAVRENLFQPFFRGEARESREGLGLGLFIASEIARAHGGTIDVTSDTSSTRFTLKIIRLSHE